MDLQSNLDKVQDWPKKWLLNILRHKRYIINICCLITQVLTRESLKLMGFIGHFDSIVGDISKRVYPIKYIKAYYLAEFWQDIFNSYTY
jgi:hypothetical protein